MNGTRATSGEVYLIVGVDRIKQNKNSALTAYRVMLAQYVVEGTHYDWKFKSALKDENWVKSSILSGSKWINAGMDNITGEIKGVAGSLNRFNNNVNKPLVIISQLINSNHKTVGYKVADYNGCVKNIKVKELIEYAREITLRKGVPVQNAMFVDDGESSIAHFKSYPLHQFIVEELRSKRNPNVKPAVISVSKQGNNVKELQDNSNRNSAENKKSKSASRLESIFSKGQIRELKKGKEQGVDFRIYANPRLSERQMYILRESLLRNVNVKSFASPDFKPECMQYLAATSATGGNIKNIINPEYSVEQLTELFEGQENGVDISVYSDPKISAEEMQKKRIKLENEIYFSLATQMKE